MVRVPYPNIDVSTNDLWSINMIRKRPLSKTLSKSTPSMAASVQTLSTASSTTSLSTPMSSSGQKRFHRYFSQAPAEEYVIKYYSCALVADILLQGHLYITPNYFAFYSNVFGYVTRYLIPLTSVAEIKKQKTVKIIPNAISVATDEKNYVFCSLFARDSTFKLMNQIWEAARNSTPSNDIPVPNKKKFINSETGLIDDSETSFEEDRSSLCESEIDRISIPGTADGGSACVSKAVAATKMESATTSSKLWGTFRSHTIIAMLVVLLAVLYLSAAVMMIRIDRLQTKYHNHPQDSMEQSLKNRFSQHLKSNLDHIVKVRQNLQSLSEKFAQITEDTEFVRIPSGVLNLEDTLR